MTNKILLTKKQTYSLVLPYRDVINSLITESVNWYRNKPPLDRLIESPRTRASSISDKILWNICHSKTLLSDPNIRIRRRYGVVRIFIQDLAQVVFKKLNNNFMPSRPSSPRSLGFFEQSDNPQEEFPDLPNPVTNLYWGYIWDPVNDPLTPIVCLDGSQLQWFIAPADIQEEVDETTQPTEQKEKHHKRARPKHDRTEKKQEEDDNDGTASQL